MSKQVRLPRPGSGAEPGSRPGPPPGSEDWAESHPANDPARAGVLARFVEDLLRGAEARGADRSALIDGLPVTRVALAQPSGARLPWDEFVETMRRIETALGGATGLEELGRRVGDARIAPVLRRMAGFLARPAMLYRASVRWALPRATPQLQISLSPLPMLLDGRQRLRVECAIPPSIAACPQLLHVTRGGLRAVPRILGLPEALVESRISQRRASYTVSLPPARTPWARLRQAARALFSSRAALDQLAGQQHQLGLQFADLEAANAQLAESEARYRALTESAIDIVLEVGGEGEILYASPSIEERVGLASAAVVGTRFQSWLHPDDAQRTVEAFDRALDVGEPGRPICRVRHRDGHWVWLEIEGRTFLTRSGRFRLVAILRDISERVRVEEEQRRYQETLEAEVSRRTEQLARRNRELRELQSLLVESQRLDVAQDLAGRVAHSINSPLAALIGNLQLASEDGGMSADAAERMLVLAHRVGQVVERTLELYRERKIDRATVAVDEIFDDLRVALEPRAAERGVRLDLRKSIRSLDADRALLVSALVGVVENAIDVTPRDGVVLVEARAEMGAGVFVVEDTGPGVPAEVRDRIFEPFFTTKGSGGTGLGLAIAHGVVQGHGGEIEVEARPGGGSVFRVEIPCGMKSDPSSG